MMTTPRITEASSHSPEQDFAECGGEQHVNEHVVDLHEEPHERAALAAGREAVGAVFFESLGNLAGVQSGLLIRSQLLDHLRG
jgi:hypothetical protein